MTTTFTKEMTDAYLTTLLALADSDKPFLQQIGSDLARALDQGDLDLSDDLVATFNEMRYAV